MSLLSTLQNPTKIKTFEELAEILEQDRKRGLKIVQCHGVFDLLHPGHIRHFKEAKAQGDRLVVSVTPDRFVNKGPGRPAFTETLRLEALAALGDIDYVVLNDSPDAVSAIQKVRPSIYVKGMEYKDHGKDITGKISQEVKSVEALGGVIYYTDDVVFSSSSLLNRYFDSMPPQVTDFLSQLRQGHSADVVLRAIESLSGLKVLVIGDAIIDEYQYVAPLGQSGKGLHMVAKSLEKEIFLGGSLIIANHVAQFAGAVTLVTALGKECPYNNFIRQHLDPKIQLEATFIEEMTTLTKKRYVLKDGQTLHKLFETYSSQEELLDLEQTNRMTQFLQNTAPEYDLVLVADFGNGFTNSQIMDTLSDLPCFLALNTQINSGNRGFNVVTNYHRADYISVNEAELRLAAHDRISSLEGIASDIAEILHCRTISVTQGVKGVSCFSPNGPNVHVPALVTNSIDRVGAGDSYLSLSSLCLAAGHSPLIAGFVGSAAAGMSVQMVGNQEPIKKAPLCKFITRLLK